MVLLNSNHFLRHEIMEKNNSFGRFFFIKFLLLGQYCLNEHMKSRAAETGVVAVRKKYSISLNAICGDGRLKKPKNFKST